MASKKALTSTALLLSLNLLFVSMVTSTPIPSPFCPISPTKFNSNACLSLLSVASNGFFKPPTLEDAQACCNVFQGLDDAQAASCLCRAFKDSGFGTFFSQIGPFLNIPNDFASMLSICGRHDAAMKNPCS